MTAYQNQIQSLKPRLLQTGVVCILLSAAGFFLDRRSFASSYLVSFLFWFNITLGAFPMICLHHLTGGNWGYPIRRMLEASFRLIPLVMLFILPLFLNLKILYPWAQPGFFDEQSNMAFKKAFLNIPSFAFRTALYFVIWAALSHLRILRGALKKISGAGLILYGLTGTFSAIDWGMSLEPDWYSTIYALLFMAGQTLAGFAFAVLMLSLFSNSKPFSEILTENRAHDLGNLLFAFVLIWAYMNLSQLIIIWSGNLSEEVPWYIKRADGGWLIIVFFLTFFHFIIPFFLLLMRRITRNIRFLGVVTSVILAASWINLYWLIKPALEPKLTFHWLDVTSFLALGCFWLLAWFHILGRSELILKSDPVLT